MREKDIKCWKIEWTNNSYIIYTVNMYNPWIYIWCYVWTGKCGTQFPLSVNRIRDTVNFFCFIFISFHSIFFSLPFWNSWIIPVIPLILHDETGSPFVRWRAVIRWVRNILLVFALRVPNITHTYIYIYTNTHRVVVAIVRARSRIVNPRGLMPWRVGQDLYRREITVAR